MGHFRPRLVARGQGWPKSSDCQVLRDNHVWVSIGVQLSGRDARNLRLEGRHRLRATDAQECRGRHTEILAKVRHAQGVMVWWCKIDTLGFLATLFNVLIAGSTRQAWEKAAKWKQKWVNNEKGHHWMT